MKPKLLSVICLLLLICPAAIAQTLFSISGTIKTAKGDPLESANVFLAGSQRAIATNAEGKYELSNIEAGTYDLMVSMIGYAPIKHNFTIRDRSIVLDTIMKVKPVMLAQVNIGKQTDREGYLKTFIKYFMGESENAKACRIINPQIIEFSTQKSQLKAYTDEFLIIENPNLGYRIKYLLRDFNYDKVIDYTFYEGESVFEEMQGNEQTQQVWLANRRKAYDGSLMHYFRALHANKTRDEGFLTYQMQNFVPPIAISPNPVNTEQIINRVDSNFMKMRYTQRLYVLYDKKKAAEEIKMSNKDFVMTGLAKTGSILMLDAEVDKRGSIGDRKTLLIQNFWGKKRIGDQLPIEYIPMVTAADPVSK